MTKKKKLSGRTFTFLLITIPALALFFCFNTLPSLKGFAYNLTNFKDYDSYDMMGLRNYIDLLQDARIREPYVFTFKLALVSTLIVNMSSLVPAPGLNNNVKGKNALYGFYSIPNILGELVASYIFSYLFTYILSAAGSAAEIGFLNENLLSSTKVAWFAIVLVCTWQPTVMNTIIYISGLQTMPGDVYEAGAIDGVTGWNKLKSLTFPLIIPFLTINIVFYTKNFLMVFDQIMTLTKGGPVQNTESISYLIYNNGMSGGQFRSQSANAVTLFIIIVAIVVTQMRTLDKREEQL